MKHARALVVIAAAWACLGMTGTIEAATLYVYPNGSGPYPTIQAAVTAANHGDSIVLGDGVFAGAGNRDVNVQGKAILIRSASGNPASCVIDCESTPNEPHRAFRFIQGEGPSTVLQDITVTRGYADYGGAAEIRNASPAIRGCVFVENRVSQRGGAIFMEGGTTVLYDCQFRNNFAIAWGGAIAVAPYHTTLTMEGCVFVENVASGQAGGAISGCVSCTIEGVGCTFERNQVGGGGGAVYSPGEISFRGCTFTDNVSNGAGGAIDGGPVVLLEDCTFARNRAGGFGGAIIAQGPWVTLRRSTIVDNLTGVPAGGAIWTNEAVVTIENTIVFGNRGGSQCSGVVNWNLVYAEFRCNDVAGNEGSDWFGYDPTGTDGNISVDPRFCGYEDGDYTLEAGSPCAPEHNPECGLIGAWPVGCEGPVPAIPTTWGRIKSGYRR